MRVLDLFSGAAGGWSLGLHRAGMTTIAACEADPWRRAVFLQNFPGVRMYDDVRTLTGAQLRADGLVPDIVVGSPPCQDISAANHKGQGVDGERSGLFFEAVRIVREVRPRWVALENSPRFRIRGADRVLGELEEIGYACRPLVVGARHAGAPHPRDRVWLIAWLDADAKGNRQHGGASTEAPGRARPEPRGASANNDADIHSPGIRIEQGRLRGPLGQDEAELGDAAHADREGQHGRPGHGEMGRLVRTIDPDTDEARHAGQRIAGDDGEELPAALRDFARAWPDWNGGLAGLAASSAAARAGGMADGVPTGLSAAPRNLCIAAYGDAVVPQITEAIGRAILKLDAALTQRAAA